MAEPLNELDKLNEELGQELDKNNGNKPKDKKTASPAGENADKADKNQSPVTPQKNKRPTDGISRAYDFPEAELYSKPVAKKEKKEKNWDVKPPERKKGGKGGSGKDIMEVFWNEFIIASFDWVCDTVVDTTLDFVEWVLYAPYHKKKEKTEPAPKKDAYSVGDDLYTSKMNRLNQENEKIIELHNNLYKANAGLKPEWKVWHKEPHFFPKLFTIYKKGIADKNSPEADFLKKIGFEDDNLTYEDRFKKEKALFTISNRIATLHEKANESEHSISLAFSQNLNSLSDVLNKKDTDIVHLKQNIKEKINTLSQEASGGSAIEKNIMNEINAINNMLEKETDAKKLRKTVSKHVKTIHKLSKQANDGSDEELMAGHIQNNSKAIYKKLMENIDKIEEASSNNPEEAKENIRNYLKAITDSTKIAKTAVDKAKTGGIIKQMHKKEAGAALANINEVIDNFAVNGISLSQRQAAKQKDEFVLTEEKIKESIQKFRQAQSR